MPLPESQVLDPPGADAALTALRASESVEDPFAQLAAAEAYVVAAWDAKIVPPLTIDREDLAEAPDDAVARTIALRDRLRRLGYELADVPGELRGAWDQGLHAALLAFQQEAGLHGQDGELTVESWDALQELFSFETPMDVPGWFTGDEPDRTLLRAVRLRLHVLGIEKQPPFTGDFQPADEAVRAFCGLVEALGVAPEAIHPQIDRRFAEVLFGHDHLVDRLAECSARLEMLSGDMHDRAEHFLVCVGKIELWLHGYDVVPDGSSQLVQPAMHGAHGQSRVTGNKTAGEFNKFLREVGGASRVVPPGRIATHVPGMLLHMRALRRESREWSREQMSSIVVQELEVRLRTTKGLWKKIREAASRVISGLFDGVRRVISWIGRVLARGWDKLTSAAYNLWRAVYHFMGSAAFNCRKALRAFGTGVQFFFSRGCCSEPAASIVYLRRADFDSTLMVNMAGEPSEAVNFGLSLTRKAQCLAIACRIIHLAATAVRIAARGFAANLGGFIPAIFGLASVYSQIRVLAKLLEALPDE